MTNRGRAVAHSSGQVVSEHVRARAVKPVVEALGSGLDQGVGHVLPVGEDGSVEIGRDDLVEGSPGQMVGHRI